MNRYRFWTAIACYVILSLIVWRTQEGSLQLVLWVFFAGLAVKTWIAEFRKN